jgi:NodT family efflux transporter outer membrane factor (OMF) lipoprotein
MKRLALFASVPALAALLAGCAVGPDYRRPDAPVPDAWKEAAGKWKTAEPKDQLSRGQWWDVFQDPGLAALEEQLDVSNQSIAQAEAQFRAAAAISRGARAAFLPSITTSPSASRSQGIQGRASTPGTASSTSDTYQLPVDASWEIDLFGRIRRNLESGLASEQAAGAQLEAVRLAMQAQLASIWFTLQGVDAQQQLLATNVAGYEKALDLTTNRYKQGVVSGVDVAQAKTQLESTRAQLTELGITRAQQEHALAVLIGKAPSTVTIPSAPLSAKPPEIPVGLPSGLVELRPDVAVAERRMAAANAQIGVAKAAYFPTLTLSGSAGYQSSALTDFFSLPNRFWSLGPAFLATLFDGGRRKAATDQAIANYDATVASYRATVLGALQDVEDNLVALRLLEVEAAQQAEAVTAAERALAIAKNRYDVGITTYLEVVTAQSIALGAERTALDLATRRMTGSVNLVRALGGGWKNPDAGPPLSAGR